MKIDELIEQRKNEIEYLTQLLESGDCNNKSPQIMNNIIAINKLIKYEEDLSIVNRLSNRLRNEKLNRILNNVQDNNNTK